MPLDESASKLPITQTRLERVHFDHRKWTAVEIERPCVVLVGTEPDLVVMFARRHTPTADGDVFESLRVVSIPTGARLHCLELLASIGLGRLSSERLHMSAVIRTNDAGNEELLIDDVATRTREREIPLRTLTGSQFQWLTTCQGRYLRSRLVSMFRQHLPDSIVNHRSWLFTLPSLRWRPAERAGV